MFIDDVIHNNNIRHSDKYLAQPSAYEINVHVRVHGVFTFHDATGDGTTQRATARRDGTARRHDGRQHDTTARRDRRRHTQPLPTSTGKQATRRDVRGDATAQRDTHLASLEHYTYRPNH